MHDQSQKWKTFVRGVTRNIEIGERTEKFLKFRHEKRLGAGRAIYGDKSVIRRLTK